METKQPKINGDERCCQEERLKSSNGFDQGLIEGKEGKRKSSSSASGDELGQIDSIIGHYGKYQLLIFLFKILIGVTSAFNNLGVTFFAPSDFVGFKCIDGGPLVASNHSATNLLLNPSPHQYNNNLTLRFENPSSMYHNHSLMMTNHHHTNSLKSHNNDFMTLFSDFIANDERTTRHSLNLNYDTPKKGILQKECKYLSPSDNKYHKCSKYQYDTGIWISTIIDEWDLICDRAWFISVTQSVYMSGFIVSYLVFGYISDRLGRWKCLFIGALIEVSCGFGCALANSITSFIIFRFLLGIGNAGRTSSSYLIMIEWTGPKWRIYISTLGSLGWVAGYCAMPWISLYFLHFRHLQMFVCFYELIFVIWLLTIPESPRWLLTHKKFDQAYEVLLTAAKFNGLIKKDLSPLSSTNRSFYATAFYQPDSMMKINGLTSSGDQKSHIIETQGGSDDLDSSTAESTESPDAGICSRADNQLKPYTVDEYNVKFQNLTETICAKEFTKNENRLSFVDIFKWKNLRRYFMIIAFVWAGNSFIYYGIVLRVGDFGAKNLFVTFTVAGLLELPSILFTIIMMQLLPRKTTNLVVSSLVGILCAIQIPLKYYDYQWLQQISIMLAKLFNSCAFTVILYQTMELFPTSMRQTAYSACSLAGRIGSILAPFIKELSQITNTSVPPMIYAFLSLISAILLSQLPETKGSDLPDTLLEAEKFRGTDSKSTGSGEIDENHHHHHHHTHNNGHGKLYPNSSDASLIRRNSVRQDDEFEHIN